jgi:hypothetical protein
MNLAEREELFFILSSKLEKEDAEFLEKKVSTWILERENKSLKFDIDTMNDNIDNCNKKYVDSKNTRQAFENVANEREIAVWELLRNKMTNRLNSNRDNLIEILK